MDGQIRVDGPKAIWLVTMTLGGLVGLFIMPSLSGFLVFASLSILTLLAGHSVGMHRLLIHRAFRTRRPIRYILVYLGTLVGMAGPFGMIRAHDMRD